MPKLKFRGAELRSQTGTMEEGGLVYRLHFQTVLSRPIADAMGWDILDEKGFLREGLENPRLAGILRTDNITLEPNGLNGEDKGKHSFSMDVLEVSSFQAVTKKNDDSREVSLRLCATTSGSIGPLEKWWRKWGNAPCLMTVEGVRQAEMEEEQAAEEEQGDQPAADDKPKRKRKKQGELIPAEEMTQPLGSVE